MNLTSALKQFSTLAAKATRAGKPITSINIERTRSDEGTVYARHRDEVQFHCTFRLDRSAAKSMVLIETLFQRELRQASPLKTTTMTAASLHIQKDAVPLHRAAYGITVKKVAESGRRVLRGVATAPDLDRQGDRVLPKGCTFSNPVVLLLQHDHKNPIGRAWLDQPTEAGVAFRAEIASPPNPGELQTRCNLAWDSVVAGLIDSVSIGFRPLAPGKPLRTTGGLEFPEIEILELSLVSVPALPSAKITAVSTAKAAEETPRPTGVVKFGKSTEPAPMPVERKQGGAVKLMSHLRGW